jgi:hypothetical protein
MDPVELDPRVKNARPMWALAILTLPLIGFVLTVAAYVVMVSLGLAGRPATGDRVTLVFAGCPAARPLVEARVADMGLPATWSDAAAGFRAELQLPPDPLAAEGVPAALAAPGVFEVRGGDEVLATHADVIDASVRLDLSMTPTTLVRLSPDAAQRVKVWVRAHPSGRLDFVLDGERIGGQSAMDPVAIGEVEISPPIKENQQRMLKTAAWSVIVDHAPLPCPVSVARE